MAKLLGHDTISRAVRRPPANAERQSRQDSPIQGSRCITNAASAEENVHLDHSPSGKPVSPRPETGLLPSVPVGLLSPSSTSSEEGGARGPFSRRRFFALNNGVNSRNFFCQKLPRANTELQRTSEQSSTETFLRTSRCPSPTESSTSASAEEGGSPTSPSSYDSQRKGLIRKNRINFSREEESYLLQGIERLEVIACFSRLHCWSSRQCSVN